MVDKVFAKHSVLDPFQGFRLEVVCFFSTVSTFSLLSHGFDLIEDKLDEPNLIFEPGFAL